MDKLKQIWLEARGKLSTYVAMVVAGAGELRDNWGQIEPYVPHWPWATWLAHHIFILLGILVIYARIRRALGGK